MGKRHEPTERRSLSPLKKLVHRQPKRAVPVKVSEGNPEQTDSDPIRAFALDHDYTATLPGGAQLPPGVLEHIRRLERENASLREQVMSLKAKMISIELLREDYEGFCAVTGLSSYSVFKDIFDYLEPSAKLLLRWRGKSTIVRVCHIGAAAHGSVWTCPRLLSLEEHLFAVLVRIWTGSSVCTIAKLFGQTRAGFSLMFTAWINFLAYEQGPLLPSFLAVVLLHFRSFPTSA